MGKEKGHLLEKTARHQNLDCSTLFEQMPKKNETARKSPKKSFRADAILRPKCQLLDKNIEKCQLLEFKKVESLEHVWQFG